MGNVVIQSKVQIPHEGLWLETIFDVYFSSSYATGGDTITADDIERIAPHQSGSLLNVMHFDGEAAETVAVTTFTSDATAPADGSTVTIGFDADNNPGTYRFKTAIVTYADVLIGANATAALNNLKAAINGEAGYGTTYHTTTIKREQLNAFSVAGSPPVLTVRARVGGTRGNGLATTTTGTVHTTFPGATFNSGTPGTMTGWKPTLDRQNNKILLWNGTTERANATDNSLYVCRCRLAIPFHPFSRMPYN